jgi:hypothetical protein
MPPTAIGGSLSGALLPAAWPAPPAEPVLVMGGAPPVPPVPAEPAGAGAALHAHDPNVDPVGSQTLLDGVPSAQTHCAGAPGTHAAPPPVSSPPGPTAHALAAIHATPSQHNARLASIRPQPRP